MINQIVNNLELEHTLFCRIDMSNAYIHHITVHAARRTLMYSTEKSSSKPTYINP
jgi:hypothetical protein